MVGVVARSAEGVLGAFTALCGDRDYTVMFPELEDNAIFNQGGPGEDDTEGRPWHQHMASAMMRVGRGVNVELLGKQLITYFIEWCSTPKPSVRGFVYADTTILYDTDQAAVEYSSTKDPSHNLYMGLDIHVLSAIDPVLEAMLCEVELAYERTFWANEAAYDYCKACEAIARICLNVSTITAMLGPGGVGLSLLTGHTAAMYPGLHKLFDPNIFFDEWELRKQVKLLIGAIIYSGQEKPETYKKMATPPAAPCIGHIFALANVMYVIKLMSLYNINKKSLFFCPLGGGL